MQNYELVAYLGDVEATDGQRDALQRAADFIDQRYPGDRQPQRETAFSAAAQVILGDDTLDAIGQTWRAARIAEREAMERLTGAIAASAAQGSPETVIAEAAGVDRMTVRKALGK